MSTLVWRPFLCRIARHSIYMNATPSSSESLKIDEQQLDLYIENIIEATASSLGDIVIRVSSSTKQSDKEFVFEPGGGTPIPAQKYEASLGIDAPSQEVPVQESSDPPVDQPPQSPSSPKPSGKKIKSHWFKWPRKSSAVRPTTEDIEKDHCDESGNDIFLLNTGKVPLVSKLF